MYRVLTCLAVEHDYRLVVLAVLISAAGALASFKVYGYVAASHGLQRWSLLFLTGLCSGSAIWATHFIAMLAYEAGVPVAYEPVSTAGSFVIAIASMTAGFAVSAGGARWRRGLGGAVIGLGIGGMHFAGMRALIVPGTLQWDVGFVVASLVIGLVFAALAMVALRRSGSRRALWTSAGLFALAICGLHFTAMSAVTVLPDPTVSIPQSPIGDLFMAFAVSGASLAIMLSAITSTALMENKMRRQRENELRTQNLRFDLALANMGEGLCMFDGEKRLVVWNNRYATMYRLPPELLKPGTPHCDIIKHRVVHGLLKGEASDRAADRMISTLGTLPSDVTSSRIDELADGRLICVTRQPMADGGWVATHLDVTEQRRAEARITYLAQHDALTDLPNRVLLRERLDHALAGARRGSRRLAVLLMDLDRFKEINDSFGHPMGDALLRTVAARLRSCLRETATIARLGGDEFAIVDDIAESAAEAAALAERIQRTLSSPIDLGDHQVIIGISTGIAIAPDNGTETDDLLKKADLALLRAKSGGRSTHRFFAPEMDACMQARRTLERDMRSALANGELELHYQPFVNGVSGAISGFEALMRWRHPQRGMIMPGEFIPVAEETGMIVTLGEWALRTACAEAATWPGDLKVAVNLSPAQFRSPELVSVVVAALSGSGIAPQRLELEVTESVMMQDCESVFAALGRLRELGVGIALDDFGTGYSSLGVLQRFAFDKIKIDRTFINGLLDDQVEARLIARAVVRFAVGLGKMTTAEGIETKEQLEILRAEKCAEMQGYYFSRPTPAADIGPLLLTEVKIPAHAA